MVKKKSAAQLDRDIAEFLSRSRSSVVDVLLPRFQALQTEHAEARNELRDAAREADRIMDAEERGHAVDPTRKAGTEKRWTKAVRAEKSLTSQMRDVVLRIRRFDPTRIPRGWENTQ